MGNVCSGSISVSCDAVLTRCIDCTVRKGAYISKLEDNVNVLKDELSKLIELRDDVMIRVVNAEQRQLKRLNQVQGWLSRVQIMETEVGELIRDSSQEIEKLCLGGYCSRNCKSSYKLGKKVAKKLQIVVTLKGEGAFEVVAERVPEAAVDERPTEPKIVGLHSTFDKVWRCLRKEQVGVIGLYGTGGVGKTTLLTQINNKFLDTPNDFDVVIWVVVSKDLQLESIQEKIAKKVNLFDDSWKNKSLEDKASDIFKILSKKKFVLLLDDIWEEIDLKEIGVPSFPALKDSSKMIFTTREFGVCGKMKAHMSLEVKCLGDDESWELFQENIGKDILQGHPDIPKLAKIITKECGGLPLALITIGRAMACRKTPEEWKHAIEVLRVSAATFSGIEKKVFSRLKFSYDNLHSDTIRSCFLYCSLFPEDYKILKEELIDCWIGEGILNEYDGSGERNYGHSIIGDLLSACLLEGGNYSIREGGEDFVKMHDVIRDMALWIACDFDNEGEKFLVHAGVGLTEAPVGLRKDVKRLSLMINNIKYLSEPFECHHLLTLLLNKNRLINISNGFFQYMSLLKVLKLSNNKYLKELPSGISELVALQHLDLSYTNIRELSMELKALRNLKCLNLEHTPRLLKIPLEVISNFSMLHVLRMFRCGYNFRDFAKEDSALFGGGVVLVKELLKFERLNVLTIDLTSYDALKRFMSSHKLHTCTKSICLHRFDNSKSPSPNQLSLVDLRHLQNLEINDCDFLEVTKMKNVPSAFHSLHTVQTSFCNNLRDMTWLVLLPNLKFISICYCRMMREIIDVRKLGDVPETLENLNYFPKLEYIQLEELRNLKSIYWKPLPFPHLKEIKVIDCPKLKKLSLGSNSAKERKIVITGDANWWKELQWEDPATQNAFLSSFKPRK